MITEKDFMDKKKYPLTTQDGLGYSDQRLINSVNYDNLVRFAQDGNEMDEKQKAIQKELAEKLERNFEKDVKNTEAYS